MDKILAKNSDQISIKIPCAILITHHSYFISAASLGLTQTQVCNPSVFLEFLPHKYYEQFGLLYRIYT